MNSLDKGKELAEKHWNYIKSLLEAHNIDKNVIELIGFHYKTALEHGFKHGLENKEGN